MSTIIKESNPITSMDQVLDFYYAWHKFEATQDEVIIDFDLVNSSEKYANQISSRAQAAQTMVEIQRRLTESDESQYVRDKLRSAEYYLSALMGEVIQFDEYLQNTIGITPVLFSEQRINEEKDKVKFCMDEMGYDYTKAGVEKLAKDSVLESNDAIIDAFADSEEKMLAVVMDWLGIDKKPEYEISFTDEDVFWMNYIYTDLSGKVMLKFNLHRSLRHKWRKGSTEFFMLHEICCHAIQAQSWKQQIREKNMHPFCGLTSVFAIEQFVMEGIAQTLQYFLPNNLLSVHGQQYLHVNNLFHFVSCNAHVMVNRGVSIADAVKYVQQHIPGQDAAVIEKDMNKRLQHPLFRTYQYVYGIGAFYFQEISKQLDESGKREFVLDIHRNVYTPSQLLEKYLPSGAAANSFSERLPV